MKKPKRMTKAKPTRRIKQPEPRAPDTRGAFEHERLLHELHVHQVELETQNRELREAQQLIELSRDRYADLYDFAPVGYVTLDHKGVIREINLTAAGMLGVERTRLVGVPFHLHVAREDLARFRGHLAELSDPEQRVVTELHLARKGGSTLPVVMQSVLVYDVEKKTRLCRAALTDITARQQAEQALHDNEARLRAVLDTAAEGIITIDERGTIESFNQAAEKLFGYPAVEAMGQNISLLMPSPYREQHDGYLSHYRDTRERKIIGIGREVSGRRKDGGTFPLELSVSEVRLAGRRIFTGIVRDLTKRRQAEEALRVSEERFRLMADHAPVLVWMSGPDKLCTWFNRPWLEFTGRSLEQELGNGWAEGVHPDDLTRCLGIYEESFMARKPFAMEYRLRRKDGEWRWVYDQGVPLCAGKTFTGYIGSCVDITERKQAELVRGRLAAIVESSTDAIVGRALDGTITEWNKGAEAMLGYSAEEIVGQSILTLVPPERQEELRHLSEQVLGGEIIQPFETVRIRKDGKPIEVAVRISPIRDADRNIIGVSSILRDITERKRLEAEVLEISEREQSRIGQDLHDGLCQHLAGIEFRLLGLKQYLEGKSSKRAADTTEMAKLVRQGIEQTRTLARGLSPVMLEPGGLMNSLQELATSTEQMFHISCSLNCPAPVLIHNNAVATHLFRIAQEAVHNAIRHGKAKFIVINLFTQNDRIVLGVNDDGIGLPKKPRKHNGMGLRVMQYRAGMVGGSLVVQHEPDGGTAVVCSLRSERAGPPTERPGGRRAEI